MISIIDSSFAIDGVKKTIAGFCDYSLYYRFLQNPADIDAVLQDRKDIIAESLTIFPSANLPMINVLGMAHNINHMYPSEHPNFYSAIPDFADYCVAHFTPTPVISMFDIFADCQFIMPDKNQRQDHWHKCNEQLVKRPHFYLVSVGNEWDNNGFDPREFSKPSGILSTRGSGTGGVYPILPAWDFNDYHPRRDDIKGLSSVGRYLPFVVGGDPDQNFPGVIPTIISEYLGAAEVSIHNHRTNRPADHYRAAFDKATWGAGGCFLADDTLQSVIMKPTTKACALAYFMAMAKADPAQRFISLKYW